MFSNFKCEAAKHFLFVFQSILCRYKPEEEKCVAVPLTTDHSPSVYAERMRIQKAGGNVRLALLFYQYMYFKSSYSCYTQNMAHMKMDKFVFSCSFSFLLTMIITSSVFLSVLLSLSPVLSGQHLLNHF